MNLLTHLPATLPGVVILMHQLEHPEANRKGKTVWPSSQVKCRSSWIKPNELLPREKILDLCLLLQVMLEDHDTLCNAGKLETTEQRTLVDRKEAHAVECRFVSATDVVY